MNPEETSRKKVFENTIYYLENYLNPDINWDRNVTPKQRINQIRYADVNWKTVYVHIKAMDYYEFLKTPYWKAISAHAKYKAGYRCQLCNNSYYLVTHHRNYAIHGREHDYMNELIVLCRICHNKFHEQIPKFKRETRESSEPQMGIALMLLSAFFIFYMFLLFVS